MADLTPSAQTRWEARVEMLHANPAGQDCVYISEHALDGTPVILRRAALKDHALIVGSTGSRKTSLSVGPFLSQLLYTIVNVLAMVRCQSELHTISAESLTGNIRWFLKQTWLDDRIRPLFTSGLAALANRIEPCPTGAHESSAPPVRVAAENP